MILFADSEGLDQTADLQADLGFHCRLMLKDMFSHGMAQIQIALP